MALVRKPIFDAFRTILGRGLAPGEVAAVDRAIDEAEGREDRPAALADEGVFFAAWRAALGALGQNHIDAAHFILAAFGAARWPLAWAAYGLATTWHETNAKMEPVREAYWLSEAWRKANLRYYPWYGRGYVQLTWERNYQKADAALGLNGLLIAEPDAAMRPDIAARVMVWGMEGGAFTGKSLADFLPLAGRASHGAYKGARQIINGHDKDDHIADLALAFEGALAAGGWS